ncbi:MAG: hypothetical protein QM539_10875, partial [Alphaproteobacteria bacterium]|nr:hypothetical protein [Alphaproteobacteria bacterium]
FKFKNRFLMIFDKKIWPLYFDGKMYPILKVKSNLLTDYLTFLKKEKFFIVSVVVHKDSIYLISTLKSNKTKIYKCTFKSKDRIIDNILPTCNKNLIEKPYPDPFNDKLLNKYKISSMIEIPHIYENGEIKSIFIQSLTDMNSQNIKRIIVYDFDLKFINDYQKSDIHYKLTANGQVISQNNSISNLIYFTNDGSMCNHKIQTSSENKTFLVDQYDEYSYPIHCQPFHIMFGCPQKFCYNFQVDDFIWHHRNEEDKNLLFRGDYLWVISFKINFEIPIQLPSSNEAIPINKYTYFYPNLFNNIDAAFSFIELEEKRFNSFFFKENRLHFIIQYENQAPNIKDITINEVFDNYLIDKVNAAMYFNKTAFLFGEDYVQLFKQEKKTGYWYLHDSLAISQSFKGFPSTVDAILQNEDEAYFLSGNFFYIVNMTTWNSNDNQTYYHQQFIYNFNNQTSNKQFIFDYSHFCPAYTSEKRKIFFNNLLKTIPEPTKSIEKLSDYRKFAKNYQNITQETIRNFQTSSKTTRNNLKMKLLIGFSIIIIILIITFIVFIIHYSYKFKNFNEKKGEKSIKVLSFKTLFRRKW